jgi:uncharacterized membrane protein
MNPIVDTIMIILFILFMIFVFGGYHKNKSAQREDALDKKIKNKKNS